MARDTDSPMTAEPAVTEPGRLVWSARWSLTTRILAVNIFAIALLAAAFFYLDSYRTRLVDARVTTLDAQLTLLGRARKKLDGSGVPMSMGEVVGYRDKDLGIDGGRSPARLAVAAKAVADGSAETEADGRGVV
ncbi:MAG: hypothetical protein HC788_16005, partial [Sphingopyxis sp.]|nr:hypothetical protein [Sphingopyxis sp.]